jgi:hypothetical protein
LLHVWLDCCTIPGRLYDNTSVGKDKSALDTETRLIGQLDLLVVRPCLMELLDRGLNGRLTLVSAPAGFGKPTPISSRLEGMAAAREEGPEPPLAA